MLNQWPCYASAPVATGTSRECFPCAKELERTGDVLGKYTSGLMCSDSVLFVVAFRPLHQRDKAWFLDLLQLDMQAKHPTLAFFIKARYNRLNIVRAEYCSG